MADPTVHLSLRAPADIVDAFDEIARYLERDRSWVLLRALRQYLDGEGRELMEDKEAIAELDRGEGIPMEQVLNEIDAKLARMQRDRRRRAR